MTEAMLGECRNEGKADAYKRILEDVQRQKSDQEIPLRSNLKRSYTQEIITKLG